MRSLADENEALLVLWTPLGYYFITTIADRSLVAGTSSAVDALAYDVILLKLDRSLAVSLREHKALLVLRTTLGYHDISLKFDRSPAASLYEEKAL